MGSDASALLYASFPGPEPGCFTEAPVLTTPAAGTHLTLTEAQEHDSLEIAWKAADYGFPASILYTVQMAKAGT